MARGFRLALLQALALVSAVAPASAGISVTTFEDQGLAPNSHLNAANPAPPGTPIPYERSGFFTSGGNAFHNINGEERLYNYWSGWAISNTTDTITNGFGNQYSAITGEGAGGSETYGVASIAGSSAYFNLAAGASPVSFEVTNTTYAALTMADGDPYGFTKPFSHELGSFFLLTITGYDGLDLTGSQVGTLGIYLADFRDQDPRKNFILSTWETVILPPEFANAASLVFNLTSSDNDPLYGMNTPAYFALDNLTYTTPAVVPEPASLCMHFIGIAIGGMVIRRTRARRGE